MPNKLRQHRTITGGRIDKSGHRKNTSDASQLRAIAIRNSARWGRTRQRILRISPICCDPLDRHGRRVILARQVHHIISLVVDPSLAFTTRNLAPLCTSCHAAIEQAERAGRRPGQLFASRIGPGGCKSSAPKALTPPLQR